MYLLKQKYVYHNHHAGNHLLQENIKQRRPLNTDDDISQLVIKIHNCSSETECLSNI